VIAAPPPVTNPTALVFWNAQRGLLGAASCRDYTCKAGTISLTTDGGRTFRVVLRTRAAVERLATAGPNGAVAFAGGKALRTTDGGRTWRSASIPPGASFANARAGLSVRGTAGDGQVEFLATADGGKTWRRSTSPCRSGLETDAFLDLVTPARGWVVCLSQPGAGNQGKVVFRTVDGVRHWHARAVTPFGPGGHGGISTYGYPTGIAFAANGFGLLWEGRGTLYVTRDGGETWTAEPKLARPEVDFGRGAAAFAGGDGFVLLGYGGSSRSRLLATHDAGRTWRVVHRWR
jgi:photosystem II stability/assembly factor-like uncharacterized protein